MLPNLDYEKRLQALERFMREIRGDRGTGAVQTWTPAFAGTGTAGIFTYTNQTGRYFLNGEKCEFMGFVTISAISTPPVGNMLITGLPFASTVGGYSVTFGFISNFNYTALALQLCGRITASTAYITLSESFDNIAAVAAPAANFTNADCSLGFSGFYQIGGS